MFAYSVSAITYENSRLTTGENPNDGAHECAIERHAYDAQSVKVTSAAVH
jgi:hypothetical protein